MEVLRTPDIDTPILRTPDGGGDTHYSKGRHVVPPRAVEECETVVYLPIFISLQRSKQSRRNYLWFKALSSFGIILI